MPYHRNYDYKPQFRFPTHHTFTTTSSAMPELISESINEVVTRVQEIVTDIQRESNTTEQVAVNETTTLLPDLDFVTSSNADVIEAISTSLVENVSEIIEEFDIVNVVTGSAVEDVTRIVPANSTKYSYDWMNINSDDNAFFNHNLTMIHQEQQEHNQALYIILGIILGVLVLIGILLLMIYISYRKCNYYVLKHECAINRNPVINRGNCEHNSSSGNDSTFIEHIDNGCYKF